MATRGGCLGRWPSVSTQSGPRLGRAQPMWSIAMIWHGVQQVFNRGKKGLTHYEFILTAFTCNAKRTQLSDAQLPTNQSFRNSMKWYKMNVVQGEGMKGMCCDMFWEVLNTSCMVPASGKSIFFRAISPAGLEQGFSGSRFQLWDCDILQDLATIWIPCLVLFAMAIRLESSAPSPDTDLHRSRAALRSFKSTV